jgi:acetyl esterase/lipase
MPTYEIGAIAQAVINDDKLPIDKSRVAIGGFSTGGNLATSAAQLPLLRGKIKAAV